jgi:hypothetical protein
MDPRAAPATLARRLRGALPDDPYPAVGFDGEGAVAIGRQYSPPRLDVAVELFVSKNDAVRFGRTLGWKRSDTAALAVHLIPGEHRVLFNPEVAPVLAGEIKASIAARVAASPSLK